MDKIKLSVYTAVFFAVYLIVMLPVANADTISYALYAGEKENEIYRLFLALTGVLNNFIDTLLPSVKAQICNKDSICGPGEDSLGCCYDCGCNAGYYCDSSIGCQSLGSISMTYSSITNDTFRDCSKAHEANVTMIINNKPAGAQLTAAAYYLNNSKYTGILSCENPAPYDNYYRCRITVPPLTDCGAGIFILNSNKINLNISFSDGRYQQTKSLTASIPALTINSFVCGDTYCDSDLSEASFCCNDCGCLDEQYCDSELKICRQDLTNSDFIIENPTPLYFQYYTPGNSVSFETRVQNAPGNFLMSNPACTISCTSNSLPCSADCTQVSCTSSYEGATYKGSCDMIFRINSYDTAKAYTLIPSLEFPVSYKNGDQIVFKTINKSSAFRVSVSENICGDGFRSIDENNYNCCIDAACDTGFYCDWYRGSGDCRSLNSIGLVIANLSPTELFTQTVKGPDRYIGDAVVQTTKTSPVRTTLKFRILDIPDTANVDSSCSFGSDKINCIIKKPCSVADAGAGTKEFTCQIEIPSIQDYDTLEPGLYDAANRRISLNSNTLDVNLRFKNGTQTITKDLSAVLPSLILNIIPGCGNTVCETELSEACCYDCGCQNGLECVGGYTESECVDPSTIVLRIAEFGDQKCTINRVDGKCAFNKSIPFKATVYNAPNDLTPVSYEYMFNDETNLIDNCEEIEPVQQRAKTYQCYIDFDDIKDPVAGSETKTIGFSFLVKIGAAEKTLKYSHDFTLTQEKSEDLNTCEQRKSGFDDRVEDALDKGKGYSALAYIFGGLALVFSAGCAVCWIFCQSWAPYLCWAALVTGALSCTFVKFRTTYEKAVAEAQSIRADFNSICSGTGVRLNQDLAGQLDELESRIESYNPGFWKKVPEYGCFVGVTFGSLGLTFGPKVTKTINIDISPPPPPSSPVLRPD